MKYLGVEKSEIIATLKDAERFIRSLNLGPETEKALDERIQNRAAYKNLENAMNEAQTARALEDGGLTEQFRRMSDIFRFYAATENDGRVQSLFNRLSAFSTFNGMTTHEYRSTDAEEDRFLMKEYIKHHLRIKNTQKFKAILKEFANRNKGRDYSNIDDTFSKLTKFAEGNNDQAFEHLFAKMDLHQRHVITAALKSATGLDEKMAKVSAPSPHNVYGIVIEDMPKNFEESSKLLRPILDRLQPVLDKYADTGDIEMGVMIGIVRQKGAQKNLEGISLFITKRVAQDVANALPDQKLVNYEGQRIMPKHTKDKPRLKF